MTNPMLPLASLSPVSAKTVVAKSDGGLLSSDGGVLLLREIEQRLRVADRLAAVAQIFEIDASHIENGTDKLTGFHATFSNGGVGSNIQAKRYRYVGFGGCQVKRSCRF